ncbi:glycosyltransferase [Bacillus paranthracis]|uniref:glycosyltransferase n=1 Tax=Bacillus paranthracis TaxID=2026186 RepID=UPI00209B66F2|nr:glycosyltransferase [Bacillus paranthracis]UTM17675.1 glycosyltransferase [Bacillus paranthracis]
MKKVLFFIYQLVGGGAEKVMVDIVNHMDRSKYEITVMTVVDCTKDRYLLKEGIKYKYIFKDVFKADRIFFKLMKSATPQFLYSLFIKEKYDIEFSWLEGIPSKILSGNTNLETKKLAIIHADCENIAWPSGRYKNFRQEEDSYNNFDQLLFVSENTRANFLKKFNIDKAKTLVLHNPFDIHDISVKSKEKVEDYIKEKEEFLFVSVGRLEKVKGFDRLIKAFKEVRVGFPNIKLLIVGEGHERKNLIKQIEELNLESNVYLMGYRENPYKYINLCNFYICSSISEGLSSSVIEAMIINKPIITTDCGGMNEILLGNLCGLIMPNTTEGIIDGMHEILEANESRLLQMKVEQEERTKDFTFEKYFRELEKSFI